MSKTPTSAPSRREANKEHTRNALREAALELFATRGFDDTKTEEIAERAGVSARTFFRYFPAKEMVLFLGRRAWIQSFASTYLGQPPDVADLDALAASFVALGASLEQWSDTLALYERAVASSPALRGRESDNKRLDLATVADAIAARRGLPHPDEDCNLLAEVGLLTHHRALERWLADPSIGDLEATVAGEFELLSPLFAGG